MDVPRHELEREMTATVGAVPALFDRLPDEFLAAQWELMKRAQLGETLIPHKYKDLIGLAVSAVSRCRFGVQFHTEAARFDGAREAEIAEALHYAGLVSGWGAMLTGLTISQDEYAAEVRRTVEHLQKEGSP